jgi:AraC-like DNA-binding protein
MIREPIENLFNSTMPMEEQVRRSQLDLVEERLLESDNDAKRVLVLEQFLLQHLVRRPDPLITDAVETIRKMRGSLRIEQLVRHTGLSQSALGRRFLRQVGVSPKKFAAFVRLRHVVKLRNAGASFTEIAHAAGYADQPHFIKDFKRFTGHAPEKFFQTEANFC